LPTCRGTITALLLFDVAEEIDIDSLGDAVSGHTPSFKSAAPSYVRFQRQPAVQPGQLRYFDYGVVTLRLDVPFSGEWDELVALSSHWIGSGEIEQRGKETVRAAVERISKALRNPYAEWLDEAYYVVHLSEVRDASGALLDAAQLLALHGPQIAQVVRGETQQLSESEQREILSSAMSYARTDLLVVGWLAGFVYDSSEGAAPVIDLLEYANTQLLEYRRYDEILTGVLRRAYASLERRAGRWRLAREAEHLNRLRLEVIELTERTDNAIKFLSDMFDARAHRLAAAKIGANDYRALVEQKIRAGGELYQFMVNEFRDARGFVMEALVILILIIELIPLFRGH